MDAAAVDAAVTVGVSEEIIISQEMTGMLKIPISARTMLARAMCKTITSRND